MLRPLGNPLPLGFIGLAAGTLLVSALQLEWLKPADGHQAALILRWKSAGGLSILVQAVFSVFDCQTVKAFHSSSRQHSCGKARVLR